MMVNPSQIIWKGMKFPVQWNLGVMKMKKGKKTFSMKCTDPIGLEAFKAGVSGKKLKKVC